MKESSSASGMLGGLLAQPVNKIALTKAMPHPIAFTPSRTVDTKLFILITKTIKTC